MFYNKRVVNTNSFLNCFVSNFLYLVKYINKSLKANTFLFEYCNRTKYSDMKLNN